MALARRDRDRRCRWARPCAPSVRCTAQPGHAPRLAHARWRGDTGTVGADVGAVVFDLGGVLIDWTPRHLYRTLFDDEAAMEEFLSTICTLEWHVAHDLGQ